MRGCSGGVCVVAPGGMHGCSGGVCMVAPGGACVVARGCAWLLQGVCVVARGGCAWLLPGGHAWFFPWDTMMTWMKWRKETLKNYSISTHKFLSVSDCIVSYKVPSWYFQETDTCLPKRNGKYSSTSIHRKNGKEFASWLCVLLKKNIVHFNTKINLIVCTCKWRWKPAWNTAMHER